MREQIPDTAAPSTGALDNNAATNGSFDTASTGEPSSTSSTHQTPVQGKEVPLREGANLLSTTEPDSIIKYANDEFCKVAGFSRAELVGEAHNIVRHPDMPKAAFKMMWDRLRSGKSWMGVVKNRCKNGDYYWVKAYATPITDNDEIVELQSVRTATSDASRARAEALYQRINAGNAPRFLTKKRLSMLTRGMLTLASTSLAIGLLASIFSTPSIALWYGLGLGTVVAAGVLYWLVAPLQVAVNKAKSVTDDPLAMHVFTGRNDEAGQLLLAMLSLETESHALVGRIKDDAEQLAYSNHDLATEVAHCNDSIEDLDAQTVQVSTAINEMSATIQDVSRNCASAADAAKHAQEMSCSGRTLVRESANVTQELANRISAASEAIARLEQHSLEISTVAEVISSVAEQTNLLALNAAIEAARAGEQGRGFAVVADEVRTLANQTHDSTEVITRMIAQIQSGTREAVSSMNAAQESTGTSVEKVAEAERAIEGIFKSMADITDMSHQIATAQEQQSAVASEVNKSIHKVADLSTELTAGVKTSAATSKEVERLSLGLQTLANEFCKKR